MKALKNLQPLCPNNKPVSENTFKGFSILTTPLILPFPPKLYST